MRTLIYIFTILILFQLTGCATANYYVKQGNYAAAINVAAKKLRKFPKKADKHILALEKAWNIEQNAILNEIEAIRLEGQPEGWVTIHALYAKLDYYQKLVEPVLPLFIQKEFRNADINILDIKQELADTKSKAATYLYAKGEQLLAQNDKFAARDAYYHFKKVKEFYQNFQDVDAKINEAYNNGQNHVLIGYSNSGGMIIPEAFMNNIQNYDERALNSEWTQFTKNENDRTAFDYIIEVAVTNVAIGPEQVRESQYTDSKQIQDGFQYVLDENGNVAKDTLGNDIKEPRYVTIKANVLQTEQTKVGTLAGVVLYKKGNGQSFQQFPFREDLVFQNFFATFTGNKKALSPESIKRIGGAPQQFPSDMQMVMDASEIIKNKSFNLVKGNIGLVVN